MNLFNILATALSLQMQALRARDESAAQQQQQQHFRGSMYGVTATVALRMTTREAHVELRGLPLGGTLVGTGWLKNLDGEAGEVELEEAFAARLARRGVSIQAASLDRHANIATVHVTVPFLGAQKLALKRVYSENDNDTSDA